MEKTLSRWTPITFTFFVEGIVWLPILIWMSLSNCHDRRKRGCTSKHSVLFSFNFRKFRAIHSLTSLTHISILTTAALTESGSKNMYSCLSQSMDSSIEVGPWPTYLHSVKTLSSNICLILVSTMGFQCSFYVDYIFNWWPIWGSRLAYLAHCGHTG